MRVLRHICRPAAAPPAFVLIVADAVAAAHLSSDGPAVALCVAALLLPIGLLVGIVRAPRDEGPPPEGPADDGGGGGGSGPVPPPEPLPPSGLGPDWWVEFERDLRAYIDRSSGRRESRLRTSSRPPNTAPWLEWEARQVSAAVRSSDPGMPVHGARRAFAALGEAFPLQNSDDRLPPTATGG